MKNTITLIACIMSLSICAQNSWQRGYKAGYCAAKNENKYVKLPCYLNAPIGPAYGTYNDGFLAGSEAYKSGGTRKSSSRPNQALIDGAGKVYRSQNRPAGYDFNSNFQQLSNTIVRENANRKQRQLEEKFWSYAEEGVNDLKNEFYSDAVRNFSQALSIYEDGDVFYLRAVAYTHLGNWGSACSDAKKAYQLTGGDDALEIIREACDYVENRQNYSSPNSTVSDSPKKEINESDTRKYSKEHNLKYLFHTTFNRPLFEIPLRRGPSATSPEIYKCPKNAQIYVIENNGTYFKVFVDGYTGYLSGKTLKRQW